VYLIFISDPTLILHEYDVNFYADDGAIVLTTLFGISFQESLTRLEKENDNSSVVLFQSIAKYGLLI
jgi:hypothetical protein